MFNSIKDELKKNILQGFHDVEIQMQNSENSVWPWLHGKLSVIGWVNKTFKHLHKL